MNQLYKTSYTGQNKINFSTGASRQRSRLPSRDGKLQKREVICLSREGRRQQEAPIETIKYKQPVQGIKKFDIDPSNLLFSRGSNVRAASQKQKRIQQTSDKHGQQIKKNSIFADIKQQQRIFHETAKEGGFRFNQERPQSKQQPRSKLSSRASLRNQFIAQVNEEIKKVKKRPDTSKGIRTLNSYENPDQSLNKTKKNLNNQQDEISLITTKIIKRSMQHPLSATVRKKSEAEQNKIRFQTALDPQFLALFAN